MSVKRYDVYCFDCQYQKIESDAGEWVAAEDFEALERERDEARSMYMELSDSVEEMPREINRLKDALNEEQNNHAELQEQCYGNGWPTGWSVFDELAKVEKELSAARVANARLLEELAKGRRIIGTLVTSADKVCARIGAEGQITSTDLLVDKLMNVLNEVAPP